MFSAIADTVSSVVEYMEGPEVDDPSVLPPLYRQIYGNPYRVLGLDENSCTIAQVRDAFRKAVLSYVEHFNGLPFPKLKLKQLVFAYHVIRGTLKGPANKLAENLDENPYMDFSADDILPKLRPMKSTYYCAKEYRAFRMLNIGLKSCCSDTAVGSQPRCVYTFDVHYCMRRHTIDKDYSEVWQLHEDLKEELLSLPEFPEMSVAQIFGLIEIESIGKDLAEFMMRVHNLLANKGLFSARLLKFLGVEFEKVQSEEEGSIVAVLDSPSPSLPAGSVWHMVDERWLDRWRKFVMGRGARRYYPPGPVTNSELAARAKDLTKKNLLPAKDYRCVNYNVWAFYLLVHGGGPTISREFEQIYGVYKCSYLQACILLQTRFRIFMAKAQFENLYMLNLSQTRSAKAVIRETVSNNLTDKIEKHISKTQAKRKKDKLLSAARLTQVMWRKKKNYASIESLKRVQKDQEVFKKSTTMLPEEAPLSTSAGLIVTDVHPIVVIGNTSKYTCKITEEAGALPFKLRRVPGTEEAEIMNSKNPQECIPGSRILAVNNYPASAMTYEELKKKLATAPWPLELDMEKPLRKTQLPSLDAMVAMEDELIQYNSFKILLRNGLKVIKHNNGNSNFHSTVIQITGNDFFYKSKQDSRRSEEDTLRKISLFDIKYVQVGRLSEAINKNYRRNKKNKTLKMDKDRCFEMVTNERTLIFEIVDDDTMAEVTKKEEEIDKRNKKQENDRENADAEEKKQEDVLNSKKESDIKEANRLATEIREKYMKILVHEIEKKKREKRKAANARGIFGGERLSLSRRGSMIRGSIDAAFRRSFAEATGNVADIEAEEEEEAILEAELGSSYKPHHYFHQLRKQELIRNDVHMDNDDETPESIYMKMKAAMVVRMMVMLCDEIRRMQIHVDADGNPVRRSVARVSLRKVN